MQFNTHSLAALALICGVAQVTAGKACQQLGSGKSHSMATQRFNLYAGDSLLYIYPYYDPVNDNFGISTTPPPKREAHAIPDQFQILGENLEAVQTHYPKYTPLQTTFANNASLLHFVIPFQNPPESTGFTLVQGPGDECTLSQSNGGTKDFYLCPAGNGQPLVAFFESNPSEGCNQTMIYARDA